NCFPGFTFADTPQTPTTSAPNRQPVKNPLVLACMRARISQGCRISGRYELESIYALAAAGSPRFAADRFDMPFAGAIGFSHPMYRRTFLQFAAAATGAGADQGPWRAGAAKTDITPKEPIWMAGYGARTHPSEGVRQPLFVKALALEDQTGAKS